MTKVSCLIPAYNEEKLIPAVLDVVKAAKKNNLVTEIIVISDGSTDKTVEVARAAGVDKIIELEKNIGKGGAVLKGIECARYNNILLLDADLINLRLNHIRQIVTPILKNEADVTIGFLAHDSIQNILPSSSGQRAFEKTSFEKIIKKRSFKRSRYSFEMMLDRFAQKNRLKTVFVPLPNLTHVMRDKKYGKIKQFISKISFSIGMMDVYKDFLIALAILVLIFIGYIIFFSPIKNFTQPATSFAPPDPSDKILIFSAHPDDETLGAGGFIYDAVKAGAQVKVVFITNGDANKWAPRVADEKIILKNEDYINEGKSRMEEANKALEKLGLKDDKIIFLGYPDRELKELMRKNWSEAKKSRYTKWQEDNYDGTYQKGAKYSGQELDQILMKIISDEKPNLIITHHPKDTNQDHQTVYRFVEIATNELAQREVIKKPLVESFLIHWKISQFPHPFRQQENAPLYPPEKLQNACSWSMYDLSGESEKAKKEALFTYESQLDSPYLRVMLPSYIRTNELFCEAR